MSHHQLLAEAMIRDRRREAAAARQRHAVLAGSRQRQPVTRRVRRALRLGPA
jgi:hypothetical protein